MACSVFQPGLCECEWYGMSSQYKQVSDNSLECLLIQCIVLVILYGHTCIGDARVEYGKCWTAGVLSLISA